MASGEATALRTAGGAEERAGVETEGSSLRGGMAGGVEEEEEEEEIEDVDPFPLRG